MDPLGLFLFVLFGAAVGTYGTIIGAGGGFIIVPVLLLLLHWPHQEAVGTSLLVVTANAASGSWSYWRQRRIDLRTGWQFALATLPGAVAGSYVVDLLSGQLFNVMFGVLLVAVSLYLFFRPEKREGAGGPKARPAGLAGWGWTERHLEDAR